MNLTFHYLNDVVSSSKVCQIPFLFLFLISLSAHGQGEIPVDMYTGSPGISVHLFTLSDHDLSEDFSLAYSTNSLRVGNRSLYGNGWGMTAGGQVSREVRGLPDDFKNIDGRQGWLYQTGYLSGFPYSNPANCTQENADNAFFNDNYTKDTEPDMFFFSAGGAQGSFVFTSTGSISLIPYQDILIQPIQPGYASADMTITGWKITTNNGVVYTFGETINVTRSFTAKSSSTTAVGSWDQTFLTPFERDYQYYKNSANYNSSWLLTQAASPSGAKLTYEYTASSYSPIKTNNPKYASIFNAPADNGGGTPATMGWIGLMTENITSTDKYLSKVRTSVRSYILCDPGTGFTVVDSTRSPSPLKAFEFKYSAGMELTSVTETDGTQCTKLPPYKFSYNSWTSAGYGTRSADFWGFYNAANNSAPGPSSSILPTLMPTIYYYPNEPAAERYRLYRIPSYSGTEIILTGDANLNPNPGAITSGVLSRIIYPTGGETQFTFEANQFYDARAGVDQYGGGLRIKSISYYDGTSVDNLITRNFNYIDPSTGHSSGKLVTRPAFALPVWQYKAPATNTGAGVKPQVLNTYSSYTPGSAALYKAMTMVTGFDIGSLDNTHGSAVGYTHTKVTRPGMGYSTFDYTLPAAYGDASAGTGATGWNPTTMRFARPAGCVSMNIIAGAETYGYATFSSAEYDYERGLLLAQYEYNSAGVMVQKTLNSYQYIFKSGSTPSSTVAMAYDRYANADDKIILFGQYTHIGDVAKVISSVAVTTYDEADTARHKSESSQYTFVGGHLYKMSSTLSDGSIRNRYLKYVSDYNDGAVSPADSTVWMINLMRTNNMTGTVIEQWSSFQTTSGGTEKVTGASLVKFRPYVFGPNTLILPRYQLAFTPINPVTDFAQSYINTSHVFNNDPRYVVVSTVNEYDNFGMPLSTTSLDKKTNGTLWGYSQRRPIAQFTQARSISLGFSDFETTSAASFAVTNGFYGNGRTGTGSNAVHPYATLTRTIVKPAGANRYLFSFWLKGTSGTPVTLKVQLNAATAMSYTFTPTGSDFQYFTQPIDVSSVTGSFSVKIFTDSFAPPSGSSPSLSPVLDDVGFYPDYASIATTTFDFPFGANSVTSPSGNSQFTTYDAMGRPRWSMDQDHNIRQRISYSATGQILPVPTAKVVLNSGQLWTSTPITFKNANTCATGVTYQWSFDGGSFSTASSSNVSPSVSYATTGNHKVVVQLNHLEYASVKDSLNYSIIANPGSPPGVGITLSSSTVDGSGAVMVTAAVNNSLGEAISYQWSVKNTTDALWNTVSGNNLNTLTRRLAPFQSLDFKCEVTASDGRYNSTTLTITN